MFDFILNRYVHGIKQRMDDTGNLFWLVDYWLDEQDKLRLHYKGQNLHFHINAPYHTDQSYIKVANERQVKKAQFG